VARGRFEENNREKPCLTGGRGLLAGLLALFLVVQGRPTCGWWWQQRLRCGGTNEAGGGE